MRKIPASSIIVKKVLNPRFSGLFVILLIGAVFFLTSSPQALHRKVLNHFKASAALKQDRRCSSCAPRGKQTIYTPIIDFSEAQNCEIVFNSRSPQEIDVTPTFYKIDGRAIVGEVVRLKVTEIRFVDLKTLLPAKHRNDRDWGGMSLEYFGALREVWAQLRFSGAGAGGSIDSFFVASQEARSYSLESVWWMPRDSTAIIALGNITDLATGATLTFGNGQTHQINLEPHATKIIRHRNTLSAGPESATIRIGGAAGSIVASGMITSTDGGFNSSIRFHDPSAAKQQHLFANGLRLKGATVRVVLKNTGSTATIATPRFVPLAGAKANQPLALSPLTVQAGETVQVNMEQVSSALAKRNDLDLVSVEVRSNGSPGGLVGAIYSTDEKTRITQELPLRNPGPPSQSQGSYPFRIDEGYMTLVSITNISPVVARFTVSINYDGGRYFPKIQELAVGETAVFDLKKMRDEAVPDGTKKILPASIMKGQFHWSIHNPLDGALLIGSAEIVSPSRAASSTHTATMGCGDSYVRGDLLAQDYSETIELFDGEDQNVVPVEYLEDMYGHESGPYPTGAPLTSLDASLPSLVSTNRFLRRVSARETGECDLYACWYSQVWSYDEVTLSCNATSVFASGGAEMMVFAPKLTGPTSITRGQSATYSVTGASAAQVTDWVFTSGELGVNGPNGTLIWGGVMVYGGTVSVIVIQGGRQFNLSRSVTVNPRTGFAFIAPAPTEVSNGFRCGDQTLSVVSPPAPGMPIGLSCPDQSLLYAPALVNGGPNNGFRYVSAVMDRIKYYYLVSPDAKNTTGTFYLAQCGDYDRGNPEGYISGAVLLSNIIHHESGLPANSHYSQYKTAQDNPSLNVGLEAEKQVGRPGMTEADFRDQVDTGINLRRVTIGALTLVEPCGGTGNASQDATCTYRGQVNLFPYVSCAGR